MAPGDGQSYKHVYNRIRWGACVIVLKSLPSIFITVITQ